MSNGHDRHNDIDPIETKEWLDAFESVLKEEGQDRATFLLECLLARSQQPVSGGNRVQTPYLNTIPTSEEPKFPDDLGFFAHVSALIRWNAMAMVLRATKKNPELGGHLATYASAATLYDVGFNYFFKGQTKEQAGDLLYIQGHSAPGIYARAFLENRLTEEQLNYFRQEVEVDGLSSYPHPWLMPDFWQFATVSMGLGPLQAIYQARFLKYLENRGLIPPNDRKVWVFCGDGEMDEPESLGAISIAAREKLDNLIFVVNCNLQRLDGPVRGNGKIIQELEGVFRGAGWNVIKVIWGSKWDQLLEKDTHGILKKRMEEALDGEYQRYKSSNGAYVREHFFGKYPELAAMVKDMSDDEIWHLNRGGLDPQKVYAAYSKAVNHKGQPTIILAKTVKGYGMGAAGEGQNITHQQKKMNVEHLKAFRDRFAVPVSDDVIEKIPYCHPGKDSKESKFLLERREKLNGFLPARHHQSESLAVPELEAFAPLLESSGEREISTTMAFVRLLNILLKDKELGKRIVPIVPDESRTFGMEGLFRTIGIYSPVGQLYEPEDAGQLMYYREDKAGQILEEGITEAGSFCSWIAAGTSYSSNNVPMIPMYIFYSMFGFQRIGDLAWAAGDMQTRGFLLGATAGRTTLAGEGLQHQDGQSHILASTIPNCLCYDPTFGYELAVIMQDGLRRMYRDQESIFYYITVMNENYQQPAMPKGAEKGIIKGMYLLQESNKPKAKLQVQLLGSGTILREVMKAADILAEQFDIGASIWSVTSFNELRKDALDAERHNRFHPDQKPRESYVTEMLKNTQGPVIAATDYMRVFADQIRAFIPKQYVVLGTDGYGRSDTRERLRHFFEVDHRYVVLAALKALSDEGQFDAKQIKDVMKQFGISADKPNPVKV